MLWICLGIIVNFKKRLIYNNKLYKSNICTSLHFAFVLQILIIRIVYFMDIRKKVEKRVSGHSQNHVRIWHMLPFMYEGVMCTWSRASFFANSYDFIMFIRQSSILLYELVCISIWLKKKIKKCKVSQKPDQGNHVFVFYLAFNSRVQAKLKYLEEDLSRFMNKTKMRCCGNWEMPEFISLVFENLSF